MEIFERKDLFAHDIHLSLDLICQILSTIAPWLSRLMDLRRSSASVEEMLHRQNHTTFLPLLWYRDFVATDTDENTSKKLYSRIG